MNTVFTAAALLAIAANASNQSVEDDGAPVVDPIVPVDPVVVVDDMWSNDKIKEHVSTNFGATEWDDLDAKDLLTAETMDIITG